MLGRHKQKRSLVEAMTMMQSTRSEKLSANEVSWTTHRKSVRCETQRRDEATDEAKTAIEKEYREPDGKKARRKRRKCSCCSRRQQQLMKQQARDRNEKKMR